MKKISVFALLTVITCPVFAEEVAAVEEVLDTSVATEAVIETPVTEEVVVKNKKTSFPHGLQFGVGISGSSGLNGFIGYANKNFDSFWAKRFGVRFDFGVTAPIESKLNEAVNEVLGSNIEIGDNLAVSDFNLEAQHYAAMVDFYPFGNTWFLGGWRLTSGYYFGKLNASAQIAGTIDELGTGFYDFKLGGHDFRYLGNSVHGTAEFDWDYRGPYLGTGFDFGLFAGFKIYLDAGVVFTNKTAQLALDVPFENLQIHEGGDWQPVDNDVIKGTVDNIVKETLADAQSELDELKFYPMVKLGFMYRF